MIREEQIRTNERADLARPSARPKISENAPSRRQAVRILRLCLAVAITEEAAAAGRAAVRPMVA
jgi:hypothetical protein